MNLTCEEVSAWLKTDPACLRGSRMFETERVFNAYNEWAKKHDYLEYNGPALGLALKALIPGIVGKQIKRDKRRFRVYILPRQEDSLL